MRQTKGFDGACLATSADSSPPDPDVAITGVSGRQRASQRTRLESPLSDVSSRSQRITSNEAPASWGAVSAPAAVHTSSYPSGARSSWRLSRASGSGSMMRILEGIAGSYRPDLQVV